MVPETHRSWIQHLPWLVEAAWESFGLYFVSIDEDPHPGINIKHSSIGTEGAALWLAARETSTSEYAQEIPLVKQIGERKGLSVLITMNLH